jgi:hypothetical protein
LPRLLCARVPTGHNRRSNSESKRVCTGRRAFLPVLRHYLRHAGFRSGRDDEEAGRVSTKPQLALEQPAAKRVTIDNHNPRDYISIVPKAQVTAIALQVPRTHGPVCLSAAE